MIDIDFNKALDLSFFRRKPEIVAKELLGKIIVRKENELTLAAKIVETEAYLADGDLSCHSSVGKTQRNAPMFEAGGILYVYKIYGVHHCINFVTEKEGVGSAVLIRAAEPILGIVEMLNNRKMKKGEGRKLLIGDLCKGPGNLAKAFGFTGKDNFRLLNSPMLFVQNSDNSEKLKISISKRIGITKSHELMLRFDIEDSHFVSGKKAKK